MAQEVLKHLNRRGDFDADAWIPTALNAIDVFQHALAYNPETRKVETVDHIYANQRGHHALALPRLQHQ
eukprot:jgi/Tetstr1/438669/TSEL_027219.t1